MGRFMSMFDRIQCDFEIKEKEIQKNEPIDTITKNFKNTYKQNVFLTGIRPAKIKFILLLC